jgi:transposase
MKLINEVPSPNEDIEETKSRAEGIRRGSVSLEWESMVENLGIEVPDIVMWPKIELPVQWVLKREVVTERRNEIEKDIPIGEKDESVSREEERETTAGARLRLKRVNRAEVAPIPARLEDLIGPEHVARLIWEEVEQLELSAFYAHVKVVEGGPGQGAIDPQILVALWLYGGSEGVDSARKLNKLCVESLPYIWLCGGVKVNYHTLSDFRVNYEAALEELLTQILGQLDETGMINWESQAQDGMRVRASAGAASFRREPTLAKGLAAAQATLAALEEGKGTEQEPLSPRQKGAQERATREKVARYEAAMAEMPAVRAVKKAKDREKARVSTTDPIARVMKMADGGYRPAYNWQFAVETTNLIITGVDVVNSGSDKGQTLPMLAQVKDRHQRLPDNWLNDGGFVNLAAIKQAATQGVTIYAPVPEPRDKERERYLPLPSDPPAVAEWRERMGTEEAKELYALTHRLVRNGASNKCAFAVKLKSNVWPCGRPSPTTC